MKGGRAIGATTADGSATDPKNYGWSRNRNVATEDIEATIYSAIGIDWSKISPDDPFGRGFEYVPFSEQDVYGPDQRIVGVKWAKVETPEAGR